MRPAHLRPASDKPVLIPGLFRRGRGFVRQAGQIKVCLHDPCGPELAAFHREVGIMLRPSLYLEARP